MAKASDNQFPSVLIGEGTVPTSPGAGTQRIYVDSADHKLKRVNSSGTVTTVEGATSGGSGILLLDYGASVPAGTPVGTIVFRKPGFSDLILKDSPAVLLTLDETTGNFADTSGNGRNFTPGTGVTRGLSPLIADGGKAASADGSGTHSIATLSSSTGVSNNVTMEARVSIPAANLSGVIFDISSGISSNGFGMMLGNGSGLTAGRVLMGVANGINYVTSGYTFPTGAGTYHVALTITSAGVWTFYVNGVQVGQVSQSFTTPLAGAVVGGGQSGALLSTIVVDQAAIFASVLSASRIAAHATPSPYGALGWWDGAALQALGTV